MSEIKNSKYDLRAAKYGAARGGHLKFLQTLHASGLITIAKDIMIKAFWGGHVAIFEWFETNNLYKLGPDNVIPKYWTICVDKGHLELMKFLQKRCSFRTMKDLLPDTEKWLVENVDKIT